MSDTSIPGLGSPRLEAGANGLANGDAAEGGVAAGGRPSAQGFRGHRARGTARSRGRSRQESFDPRRRLFLLYHELGCDASVYRYATQTAEFRRHMRLVSHTQGGGTGLRAEVTFDDGHVSALTEALPVLAEFGVRARFFITAGWTARRAGFLDWAGLRAVYAGGHEIGAHGMTHALLTHCDRATLDMELRGARKRLEDGLGARVTSMSLPGGRYNRRVLEACCAAGYDTVFTSKPRAMAWPPDPRRPQLLGRLNLRGDATAEWLERLLDPSTGVLRRMMWADRAKTAAKRLIGDSLYRRVWALANRADGTEAGGDEPVALERGVAGETVSAGTMATPDGEHTPDGGVKQRPGPERSA